MNETGAALGEQFVLLLPATRRDGNAIAAFLDQHRIPCRVCHRAAEAAEALGDEAGVLVLTDQIVIDPEAQRLLHGLQRQPPWSDLPVLLLSKVGTESRELADFVGSLTNVTLLDRPTSMRTLLSSIASARRSRTKQYEMRDQLLALQKAESALRHSDRRKDEFLAMLAHELRNPLAPIRTAIDMLPRLVAAGDSRVHATLQVVDRQLLQLTRLVDDLLDVSRITQGRVDIHKATEDYAVIIKQAVESVQPLIDEKRHTLVCSLAPQIFVDGDRARLVQCVSNLLINAAKYTDSGGTIRIDLKADDQHAVLAVSDNGMGIRPDLLPRVFELFVQDSRSLDRSLGGLGIGLSLVRGMIEMHGGNVSAVSPGPGQGSTFSITLPRAPTPASEPDAPPLGTAAASIRVLVVDDNRDAADSLALLLTFEGHAAKAVYSPRAAFSEASTFAPQVILLDIGLPEMDGYEVARRLRTAGVKARLVALSGYGQQEDIQRALAAGFDAHIAKPVELARLAKVLLP